MKFNLAERSRNLKTQIQGFKDLVNKKKKEPRSKVKSFLLGMGTTLSIFGIAMLGSSLPAYAKDLPEPPPGTPGANPGTVPPPQKAKPSEELIKGIAGSAGSLCALVVSSGSYLVGIACGVVVCIGILKAQGK